MTAPTPLTWTAREPPLPPGAVLATGSARAALAAATLRGLDRGADLTVSVGPHHLLVLGAADDLPWADGVTWLGRDGPLLVPTTQRVGPDRDLVVRALDRRVGAGAGAGPGLRVLVPGAVLAGPVPSGVPDRSVLASLAGPVGPVGPATPAGPAAGGPP